MKEADITADEMMSYKGLSAYLKLSQGTLRHKVMRNKIPFFKIGYTVRFSKKKIDSWLEEHQSKNKEQRKGNKGKKDMGEGELFTAGEGIANE